MISRNLVDVLQTDAGMQATLAHFAGLYAKDQGVDLGTADAAFSRLREAVGVFSRRSESPIERQLFMAALLLVAPTPSALVVVDDEGRDAPACIERHRRNHARCRATALTAAKLGESVGEMLDAIGMEPDDIRRWLVEGAYADVHGESFHIIPQAALRGAGPKGRGIRLDALVYIPNRPKYLVAIECDGYEWHGNKDAFTSDRTRDRALRALGCDVVRFSGSEIHRDPIEAGIALIRQLELLRKRSSKPRVWKFPTEPKGRRDG